MMMTSREAREELLRECAEDHVGLWSIVRLYREGSQGPHTMEGILRELEDLLTKGVLQVGFPAKDGRFFDPWSSQPIESVARIRREWLALGRDPDIGEIAWFTTPS
jgi:hypothetical protein